MFCSERPTKCQAERFSKIFGKVGPAKVPECDQNGDYVAVEQQCKTIMVDSLPIPRNSFDHGKKF